MGVYAWAASALVVVAAKTITERMKRALRAQLPGPCTREGPARHGRRTPAAGRAGGPAGPARDPIGPAVPRESAGGWAGGGGGGAPRRGVGREGRGAVPGPDRLRG